MHPTRNSGQNSQSGQGGAGAARESRADAAVLDDKPRLRKRSRRCRRTAKCRQRATDARRRRSLRGSARNHGPSGGRGDRRGVGEARSEDTKRAVQDAQNCRSAIAVRLCARDMGAAPRRALVAAPPSASRKAARVAPSGRSSCVLLLPLESNVVYILHAARRATRSSRLAPKAELRDARRPVDRRLRVRLARPQYDGREMGSGRPNPGSAGIPGSRPPASVQGIPTDGRALGAVAARRLPSGSSWYRTGRPAPSSRPS